MRKIPTLFVRSADRRMVVDEVTPGCEWVLAGEGRPTRKIDGTCILVRRDGMAVHAYARREVKRGKVAPPNFVPLQHDEVTGKTVGWEPVQQSGFLVPVLEALDRHPDIEPGTYELIGPKINGNPEGSPVHALVRHGDITLEDVPLTFAGLRDYLLGHGEMEGIVWHHPSGLMAKLKRRDFA